MAADRLVAVSLKVGGQVGYKPSSQTPPRFELHEALVSNSTKEGNWVKRRFTEERIVRLPRKKRSALAPLFCLHMSSET